MDRIKELIWETVYHGREGGEPKQVIAELAAELAVSENYCRRSVLPPPAGCKFDVEWLLPLMRLRKDYRVLKYVATQSGFLLVKIPRKARNKKEENQLLFFYMRLVTSVIQKLFNFFHRPTVENLDRADDGLIELMAESEGVRRRLHKYQQGELDLDFDGAFNCVKRH